MIWLVLIWVAVTGAAVFALASKRWGETILWTLAITALAGCLVVAVLGLAGL